jgi:hypothetical protein
MAFPAIAAIPLVGKALAGLKGASAAKAGMGAYKALAGAGVPKGAARFAGDKIMKIGRGLTPGGFAKNLGIPMTKGDIAMSVAPDLLFGGFAAATTEGDLADKAIAGLGSSVGGIAGGLGARGLLGPKSNLGILGTEMVGGMIGDQIGYGAANSLIRAKHGGMTPTEKLMAEQDEQYRSQIVDEFLAQNGIG